MKNQPHFSPLNVALVTGLASLVGFLSGRTVWLELNFSITASICIGLVTTVIIGLLAFRPHDLLLYLGDAFRASKGKWMQSCRERRIEKECMTKARRTHSFRRRAYYERMARAANRQCAYYTMKLVVVWVVAIISILWSIMNTVALPYLRPEALATLTTLGSAVITLMFALLVIDKNKVEQLEACTPSYYYDDKWRLSCRFWLKNNEIIRYHHDVVASNKKASDQFRELCERLVSERKRRYKEMNPFVVIAKLFCELISFIVTIPQLLVEARSFLRWLAITSILVCAKFFAIMYLKVNTTQRNSILWFSLAGFFVGFLAHYLGAHATAPFWAFCAGFLLSLFQHYVYQRFARRLEIFIDRHSTSGHLS